MSESLDGLEKVREQFIRGCSMLDESDREYLLDKIEEARWVTGATYNRGVHLLLDVVQYIVEAGYASPNMR